MLIALLTCDTGEEVGRLSGTGTALLAYVAGRDDSEEAPRPDAPGVPEFTNE